MRFDKRVLVERFQFDFNDRTCYLGFLSSALHESLLGQHCNSSKHCSLRAFVKHKLNYHKLDLSYVCGCQSDSLNVMFGSSSIIIIAVNDPNNDH